MGKRDTDGARRIIGTWRTPPDGWIKSEVGPAKVKYQFMPGGKMRVFIFHGEEDAPGKVGRPVEVVEWKYGIKLPVLAPPFSVEGTYRISGHTLTLEFSEVTAYDFRFNGERLVLSDPSVEKGKANEVEWVRDDTGPGAKGRAGEKKEKGRPPAKENYVAAAKMDDGTRILGRWRFPPDELIQEGLPVPEKLIVEFKPGGKVKRSVVTVAANSRPGNVATTEGTYRISGHTLTIEMHGKSESGPFGFKDDHLILTVPRFGGGDEPNFGYEYVREDDENGTGGRKPAPN